MFLNLLLISLAASFSVFLGQSYKTSQAYHSKVQSLSNFDTMSLAASSRVAKETNQFLIDLQNYLNKSLENKSQGQSIAKNQVREIFYEYLSKINPEETNQLNQTIDFVINQAPQAKDIIRETRLINSSYLPSKLSATSPSYISTLITNQQIQKFIDINSLDDYFLEENLKINSELIALLLNTQDYGSIISNPREFGLEISPQGLSLNDLPNGISIKLSKEDSKA
jgi:hypothetical protein